MFVLSVGGGGGWWWNCVRVYRLYSYAVAGYLEDSLLQPGLVIVYIIFSIKKTQLTCVDELKINIKVETGLVSCQSN